MPPEPPAPSAARPRYHGLDALRAVAMLLGILLHAAMSFTTVYSYVWAVQDARRSVAADWIFHGLHSFRMPLFFLVSGFFARLVVARAGPREFLRRRWRRVGLPLLLGLVTIMPATRWAYEFSSTVTERPAVNFLEPRFWSDREAYVAESRAATAALGPEEAAARRNPRLGLLPAWTRFFSLGQLWFLWYLLVFAVAGPWLVRRGGRWLGAGGRRGLDAAGVATLERPWGPLLLAAAGYPFMLLMLGLELGTPLAMFVPFPFFMLVPEINLLGLYLVYFLGGWLVHRHAAHLAGPGRHAGLWLVVGAGAFATAFEWTDHFSRMPGTPGYWPVRFGALALYSAATAFLCLGALGAFQRWFNRESRLGRYVADAAYWMYLAHLPVVFLLQAWVAKWPAPWGLKLLLVTALTTAFCLATYQLGVRGRWLGRLLNEGPARPASPPAAG